MDHSKGCGISSSATPVQLFLNQLTTVANLFGVRGKQVMAYADIMVKFPGIVAKLPPNIIAVPWFYEATPDPEYKKWLQPLIAERVPHMVASGVHSWNEIVPDTIRPSSISIRSWRQDENHVRWV